MNYSRRHWDRQRIFHTINLKHPQYAPSFKPAGRKPVKGGRWKIRKLHRHSQGKNAVWRAWRDGKGGRRFATWREAFDYTQEQLRRTYNGTNA